MADPRKPAPMSPHRARRLGRRWLVAGIVFIAVGTVLNMAGFEMVMPLPFLLAAFCFGRLFEWNGWRDGYAARMREEQVEAENSMRGETRA